MNISLKYHILDLKFWSESKVPLELYFTFSYTIYKYEASVKPTLPSYLISQPLLIQQLYVVAQSNYVEQNQPMFYLLSLQMPLLIGQVLLGLNHTQHKNHQIFSHQISNSTNALATLPGTSVILNLIHKK